MKLENLINQNRSSFDDYEPDSGHFERFENKLYQNKSSQSSLKVYLMAASMVAVSLLATLMLYMIQAQTNPLNNGQGFAQNGLSQEFLEVENYYNRIIEKQLEELDLIQCQNPGLQKSTFLDEMQEFDQTYKYLKQELRKNRQNERVISAMIETHRKKAEMLAQVIRIIKQNC